MRARTFIIAIALVAVTLGLAQWALTLDLPTGVQFVFFVAAILDAWLGGTRRLVAWFRRPLCPDETPARPFTLYLRSFKDDDKHVGSGDDLHESTLEARAVRHLNRIAPAFKLTNRQAEWKTIHLCDAIEVPDTPPGTQREEALKRWQEVVLRLAQESTAIMLLLSNTNSVLWELEQLVARGLKDRLIVVLPPIDDNDVAGRWAGVVKGLTDSAKEHPYIAAICALDPATTAAFFVTRDGSHVRVPRVNDPAYGATYRPRNKRGIWEWDPELRDVTTVFLQDRLLDDLLVPVPRAELARLVLVCAAALIGHDLVLTAYHSTPAWTLSPAPTLALQGAVFVMLAYLAFALETHWQLRATIERPGRYAPLLEYLLHATALLIGLLS